MTESASVRQRIETLLADHRVVLFMKGTRHAPSCGFSAATAGVLNDLLDDYQSVDVLADEAIRQGIKEYGNWPTIPQLYVDGELVGGADIVQGMAASGELHRLLGLPEPDRTPPDITISERAAREIRAALADADLAALVESWIDWAGAASELGVSVASVRTMVLSHQLAQAVPIPGGGARIPADFLQDGAVVRGLPGLLTLLHDGGYDDREAIAWLFTDQDLPGRPIDALRENRGSEVKRRAQAMAL